MKRAVPVVLCLAALAASLPAAASEFCPISETRDGFVALRAKPSAQATILAKMRPGDEMLQMAERSGPWVKARYWRGEERLTKGFRAHRATGWVHKSLISDLCG